MSKELNNSETFLETSQEVFPTAVESKNEKTLPAKASLLKSIYAHAFTAFLMACGPVQSNNASNTPNFKTAGVDNKEIKTQENAQVGFFVEDNGDLTTSIVLFGNKENWPMEVKVNVQSFDKKENVLAVLSTSIPVDQSGSRVQRAKTGNVGFGANTISTKTVLVWPDGRTKVYETRDQQVSFPSFEK